MIGLLLFRFFLCFQLAAVGMKSLPKIHRDCIILILKHLLPWQFSLETYKFLPYKLLVSHPFISREKLGKSASHFNNNKPRNKSKKL